MVVFLQSQTSSINPSSANPALSVEQFGHVLLFNLRNPELFGKAVTSYTIPHEEEGGVTRLIFFEKVFFGRIPATTGLVQTCWDLRTFHYGMGPLEGLIEDYVLHKTWKVSKSLCSPTKKKKKKKNMFSEPLLKGILNIDGDWGTGRRRRNAPYQDDLARKRRNWFVFYIYRPIHLLWHRGRVGGG